MKSVMIAILMFVANVIVAQSINVSPRPVSVTYTPINISRGTSTVITSQNTNDGRILTGAHQVPNLGNAYEVVKEEIAADAAKREYESLIAELDTTFGNKILTKNKKYDATKLFWDALGALVEMGNGDRVFSITEAIYTVENAYLKGRLPKDKFYESIRIKAELCKQIMKREKLNPDDNLAKNYAIQKLYQQANEYHHPITGRIVNIPKLEYDFSDYMGDSSHAQMFVSKLLASGKGQCHSMPLLYLSLAEMLHTNANLSLAPEHSFIRFMDNEGGIYNFESTNGCIVSDNWMLQSGYISAPAIKNKVYLDTLSQKQLIALCMLDLAMGYQYDYGYDDFTEQVLLSSLLLDPNGIQEHIMLSNFWTAKTMKAVKYLHLSPQALQRHQIGSVLQKHMLAQYDVIDALGYQHMPRKVYEHWLQSVTQQQKYNQQQLQRHIQYLLNNSKVKIQNR